jgi:hypothetical protein
VNRRGTIEIIKDNPSDINSIDSGLKDFFSIIFAVSSTSTYSSFISNDLEEKFASSTCSGRFYRIFSVLKFTNDLTTALISIGFAL